ncbi:hypothetical protein COLO4_21227 [Corchorus olitorius]|uniref:Uncharacterized protein n=1 Tax=Corchorus olitorius TaxID=93759 RepID=A0A1R3IUU7_9ROSI|nr:hypothetical protein COLO4_21227 [Corchorus olitorius]
MMFDNGATKVYIQRREEKGKVGTKGQRKERARGGAGDPDRQEVKWARSRWASS